MEKVGDKFRISGKMIDIHQKLIYPAEITVRDSVIQNIEKVQNCPDVYILPGMTDAHIHIESSMVTPGAFAVAAVRHGTIAVVSDPHEIANVMGMDGISFMKEDSMKTPVKFYFGAPSCVPATSFETSGGVISPGDVDNLLQDEKIKYLSEMMNFPGVINGDKDVLSKIRYAKERNKPVDGHAPGLTGNDLRKYISAGISTDHECSTLNEAREKLSYGMKILIREGSAARNLDALKELIRTDPADVMLCSDDLHPEMLRERHINKIVAELISEGYDLFDVIRSATINPAKHYMLDTGLLRTGDKADFIIVDHPGRMNVSETWINGNRIYHNEQVLFSYKPGKSINNFNCSPVNQDDISVPRKPGLVRVIEAFEGELLTGEFLWNPGGGDYVTASPEAGIHKIVVKDRYKDAPPVTGFVKGFGMASGAIASSVAHDSHNIIAVGVSDEDLVNVINELVRIKGGLAVSAGGKVHSLQLNVAGIMSTDDLNSMANKYQHLSSLASSLGCRMKAPFMTLSFMALLVIPELKIGDRGLFDVKNFRTIPLFTGT